MMKDWIGVTTIGKIRTRMISSLVALVLVLTILPISAMASGFTITVTGENNASSVMIGSSLQMIEDSQNTVTWNVYDVEDGDQLTTQNYASINTETGLLTGTEAGIVRVIATTDNGDLGSADITVVNQVGALSAPLVLQGGDMVTLGKTKFTGIPGMTTFWATSGQANAEQSIGEGTTFASVQSTYGYNLNDNPFVPAAVGQTISVVEVNGSGIVVGFGTFVVSSEDQIGLNQPPIAIANKTSVLINQGNTPYIQQFFRDPEDGSIVYGTVTSSNTAILQASRYPWSTQHLQLNGIQKGTAVVTVEVIDATGDKIKHAIEVTVATHNAPYLNSQEIPFTNAPIGFDFESNADWVSKITAIEVNGELVQPENYTITNETEVIRYGQPQVRGEILFHSGVLLEGENRILVQADGYTFAEREQGVYKPEDSYYIATLVDKTNGGITATAKMLVNIETANKYDVYDYQGTAVFQLMNGDVPVSTVSYSFYNLDDYATFRAHFNVADAATNDNYAVRAFLISGESLDSDSMGYNIATEVTSDEYDVLCREYDEWNNY